MAKIELTLNEVTKAYPGVLACHRVNIDFHRGEIHALLGENGAGKSTLVKMLGGLVEPDHGRIEIAGRPVRLFSPRAAQAGDRGRPPARGPDRDHDSTREHEAPYARVGIVRRFAIRLPRTDRRAPGAKFEPATSRLLEVVRATSSVTGVVVLDEPTAALSPQESDQLFGNLRTLARAGVAVVVVTHKLPEVLAHADRVTVLRRGRVAGRLTRPDIDPERIVVLISGAPPAEGKGNREVSPSGTSVVRFCGVGTRRRSPHEAPLEGIDLDLHRSEVIGIAGQPGSGVKTLVALLAGGPTAGLTGRIERSGGERSLRVGLIPGGGVPKGASARLR